MPRSLKEMTLVTTLDMITPLTLCPSVFGGPVWHLPHFCNDAPLTLADLGIRLIGGISLFGRESTIMLSECLRDHLLPPRDQLNKPITRVLCGGCANGRYTDTHGFPVPSLPTATGSTDHEWPDPRLVVSG